MKTVVFFLIEKLKRFCLLITPHPKTNISKTLFQRATVINFSSFAHPNSKYYVHHRLELLLFFGVEALFWKKINEI